ncbi:MAG: hypothetical protein B1H08_03765 [Candidatus Omnitrophica bacterium 4484_171]|nr:MAG: hypothetical protein B1H08_03765 [Candidatus Omnitrophica bacterium 4484_171]
MTLRCIAKLTKGMWLTKTDIIGMPSQFFLLGDWYANLFFLSREKNLILANARMLFTFIAFEVNRMQIKNIGELFRCELGRALLDEDFDGVTIQQIINDCKDVYIVRTKAGLKFNFNPN